MRVSFFTAGLFTIAALCAASAVAFIWREANDEFDPNARISITADFVAQCQLDKPQCADMVTDAMRWEVNQGRITRHAFPRRPTQSGLVRNDQPGDTDRNISMSS